MRTIKIVVTSTATVKTYESNATTYGELLDQIGTDIDMSNVKATVRETRNSLDREDALLPEGPFHIFLRAAKNEAGIDFHALEYKEMKAWIKENEEVKFFFKNNKIDGRNWTQFTKAELADTLNRYQSLIQQEETTSEVEEDTFTEETVEETVLEENVVEENSVEHTATEDYDIHSLSIQQKIDLASLLVDAIYEDIEDAPNLNSDIQLDLKRGIEDTQDGISTLQAVVNTLIKIEEELAAEIALIRARQEEEEELLKEAESFSKGFLS